MRELVLRRYCDDCFDQDDEAHVEDPEMTEVKIDVPFRGMLRIDLCSQSDKRLVQELRELCAQLPTVAVETQPAAATKPAAKPAAKSIGKSRECPYCTYETTKRNELINHFWNVHTKSGRAGKWAVPQRCPTCNAGPYAGNQGMSAHRAALHGYDALEEALRATQAKGNFRWSTQYPERPGAVVPHG